MRIRCILWCSAPSSFLLVYSAPASFKARPTSQHRRPLLTHDEQRGPTPPHHILARWSICNAFWWSSAPILQLALSRQHDEQRGAPNARLALPEDAAHVDVSAVHHNGRVGPRRAHNQKRRVGCAHLFLRQSYRSISSIFLSLLRCAKLLPSLTRSVWRLSLFLTPFFALRKKFGRGLLWDALVRRSLPTSGLSRCNAGVRITSSVLSSYFFLLFLSF